MNSVNIAAPSACQLPADNATRSERAQIQSLLCGSLPGERDAWPICLNARLCDLRPRFLAKCKAGGGHRAISRNGRVLLASDKPLADLIGQLVAARVQTWHKAILPGDRPAPFGILLCIRALDSVEHRDWYDARLYPPSAEPVDLALDVGGGLRLEFRRSAG